MAQRNAQSNGQGAFLHVRMAAEKIEQIRRLAEAEHRTLSQEVRRMIDERLEKAA